LTGREPERFSTHAGASADFAHSPATCLVATLRRFQTADPERLRQVELAVLDALAAR